MAQRRTAGSSAEHIRESEMRDQEVLRANRELAAYFKGRRTEREARAALKIIKAFVRDRERSEVKNRRPLPGSGAAPAAKEPAVKRPARRRKAKRAAPPKSSDAAVRGSVEQMEPAT
jgi:hypothetical protein